MVISEDFPDIVTQLDQAINTKRNYTNLEHILSAK